MALVEYIRQAPTGSTAGTGSPIVAYSPPFAGFSIDSPQITFSAGILALSIVAVTATDVLTISNPVSGVAVRIMRIGFGGVASSGLHATVGILKRTTLNTGGTSTTLAATPMDTNDPSIPPASGAISTANAVATAYTANPTTLGTLQGSLIRATRIFLPPNVANSTVGDAEIVYGEGGGQAWKNIVLRLNESMCINLNSQSLAGVLANIWITWTEEVDQGSYFSGL